MSTRAAITVKGFNYALDNGESLLSVKVGDELDHLNPHGGPFRVAANDGYEVTLEPITPHATPDRAATLEQRVAAAILKAAGEPPANFTDYTPGDGQMLYAQHLARAAIKVIEEAISL